MNTLNLRPVTSEDAGFLYALLEERPAYANITHRGMPTYPEHQAFLASDPYAAWYIIRDEAGVACGSVYMTRHDEVGVFVWSTQRGKGYGRLAVELLMALHPRPKYVANISPQNEVSQQLFAGLGFRAIQWTFVKEAREF